MQSAIRSERSKRYGLQYNQEEPGSSYIVSSIYAKTRDPSKKSDIQEFVVER